MKRNKDMMRGFLMGVLLCAMVVSIPMAAASATKRSIDVVYNDIKLVVDGKRVTPTDGNGNIVEPFIYNGTTFLPLRAVSNALTGGTKPVSWDQETYTVYIGERPSQEIVDMATMKTYPGNQSLFSTNDKFEVRQQTYTPFNSLKASGVFLLGGNYTTLHAFAALPDSVRYDVTTLKITNEDTGDTLLEIQLKQGEEPVEINLDVTGVDKLRISHIAKFFNATLTPIPRG